MDIGSGFLISFHLRDIRRTLRSKHIDYTNDILLKIDNQRDDDSDCLIKQIAVHDKELPLEFTLNSYLIDRLI